MRFEHTNGIYLDYLQHKVDNQVEYDCRRKLKEAELQNFYVVLSKTISREIFSKKFENLGKFGFDKSSFYIFCLLGDCINGSMTPFYHIRQ